MDDERENLIKINKSVMKQKCNEDKETKFPKNISLLNKSVTP